MLGNFAAEMVNVNRFISENCLNTNCKIDSTNYGTYYILFKFKLYL